MECLYAHPDGRMLIIGVNEQGALTAYLNDGDNYAIRHPKFYSVMLAFVGFELIGYL